MMSVASRNGSGFSSVDMDDDGSAAGHDVRRGTETRAAMATSPVVLIAAAARLPGLQAQIGFQGGCLPFLDSDALRALEAIQCHRPGVVVLDDQFATTSRGAILIHRVETDPELSIEIRVISGERDDPSPEPAALELLEDMRMPGQPLPADYRGTRAAERFTLRDGVQVHLDGDPATLVDVTSGGAQVVLATGLRPAQRVRRSMSLERRDCRLVAWVVWAAFEPPRGQGSAQYRVGLTFDNSGPDKPEELCAELLVKGCAYRNFKEHDVCHLQAS